MARYGVEVLKLNLYSVVMTYRTNKISASWDKMLLVIGCLCFPDSKTPLIQIAVVRAISTFDSFLFADDAGLNSE